MKLGKNQLYILQRMATGWELGLDISARGTPWLQNGGCGKGGEADHSITRDVVASLVKRGLIKTAYRRFPLMGYELTEIGREAIGY